MHHFKNIEPRRLFFGLIKATRRDGRGTFRTNFMETFILVILDSGRHMYIRWCKWSLKRALKSLDFVQDTARICNQSFWKPKVDPLVKQCPNMKIVHIFDIFKEPHWNTFDIDFGEALDKSDQNHQSLIISTLKLSRNQYSQMYISFLHLCLWFIFLYYIYRTIFLSPSNIQFKTRDRTYPHLTPTPSEVSEFLRYSNYGYFVKQDIFFRWNSESAKHRRYWRRNADSAKYRLLFLLEAKPVNINISDGKVSAPRLDFK